MSTLDTADSLLDPTDLSVVAESGAIVGEHTHEAIEYAYRKGWTDGLPVVPCTGERLAEFLERTQRDPDEVLVVMPHLNRQCTVREVAVSAVMAGCLPEYFPVLLAAWDSLRDLGVGRSALWQSTTGSAPMLIVNGPVADELGINSAGNIFGSGFRANATIGRAIRLTALNTFMLRPHLLDQATQGTPAKYTCCIAENTSASPWPGYHEDRGFRSEDSTVTTLLVRGTLHLEARHSATPEQLLSDAADSMARTGHLIAGGGSACLVLSPEHARLVAEAGWTKTDVQQFVYDNSVRSLEHMDRVGKGAVSSRTGWYVPVDHPDAVLNEAARSSERHVLLKPEAVDIVVAGADNAGVSAIVETTGSMGRPLPVAPVEGAVG